MNLANENHKKLKWTIQMNWFSQMNLICSMLDHGFLGQWNLKLISIISETRQTCRKWKMKSTENKMKWTTEQCIKQKFWRQTWSDDNVIECEFLWMCRWKCLIFLRYTDTRRRTAASGGWGGITAHGRPTCLAQRVGKSGRKSVSCHPQSCQSWYRHLASPRPAVCCSLTQMAASLWYKLSLTLSLCVQLSLHLFIWH